MSWPGAGAAAAILRGRAWTLGAVASLAVLGAAPSAALGAAGAPVGAEGALIPLRVEHSGARGRASADIGGAGALCADAPRAVLVGVRARSTRVRAAAPGELARVARLTFTPGPGEGVTGRVELSVEGGPPLVRAIDGASCESVARALAVVVAVALDPEAAAEPPGGSAADGGATDGGAGEHAVPPPGGSAASPTDEVPPPQPFAPVAGGPAPRPAAAAPAPTPGPPALAPEAGRWRVGAELSGVVGPLPGWRLAPGLWLAREANGLRGLLTVQGTASGDVGDGAVDAALVWVVARPEGCVELAGEGPFAAEGCALGELGLLRAEGDGIATARAAVRAWVAPGAGVRLRLALGRSWSLEGVGAATAPLLRQRYFLRPEGREATVHTVPPVAGRVGIALGGGW